MTDAKTIAERAVARKIPNELSHGEVVYSFSVEELAQLIEAVQADALKGSTRKRMEK